jgi:predicted phage baseplate assembly protein
MSRRTAIRAAGHNGVDEVEVSDDGLRLAVTFLGRAPDGMTPGNVRIDGDRRIAGIEAVDVAVEHADDPEEDDRLLVTVNRAGDTSPYRLSIVESDASGRPGTTPYEGLDQRYFGAEFRFWPQCEPPTHYPETPRKADKTHTDYTARDYDTIRQLLLDRLALTIPAWIERNPADPGVTIVELLAYTADQISYQQDAVATEAYLDTARRRVSIRRHTRLIDYPMHDGANARAVVIVDVPEPITLRPADYHLTAGAEIFEPLDPRPARLRPEHNRIPFWTWGGDERVLPAGATAATLRDEEPRGLALHPGDVLVFEQKGKIGGHCVRVSTVTPTVDRLAGQPVLDVTWAPPDALTTPLDLEQSVARGNAILVDHGRSQTGDQLHDVTQAIPYPLPGHVSAAQAAHLTSIPQRVEARLTELWRSAGDHDGLNDAEVDELSVLFGLARLERVALREHPVRALRELLHRSDQLLATKERRLAVLAARAQAGTVLGAHIAAEIEDSWGRRYATGLNPADPALAGPIAELAGDPALALPAVTIEAGGQTWTPRRDLLDSAPRDHHFVGELNDDGRLTLRFNAPRSSDNRSSAGRSSAGRSSAGRSSDGRSSAGRSSGGMLPGPDGVIRYRTGGGTAGNVGADTITELVWLGDDDSRPPIHGVRNPLPAVGGIDPEPVEQVRRLAPLDLRRRRLRAITAADYAELASGLPGVQRAAAEIRWTGSVAEAHVAVDAHGTATPTQALLDEVAHRLEAYRRIGHDLIVVPARTVPLEIVVEVCARPGQQEGRIVAEAYRRLLAAFRPDAVSFGDPVRVSRLTALAASVPGVRSARVIRLHRQFGGETAEDGLLRIGPLEVAQCDNDPDRPENGRLTIELTQGGD